MKTNVSWSTNEEARVAGKSCAKKAVLDLEITKLAVIFNSCKYNQSELIEGAKTELGTAPIIGCTTSNGLFTQEGFISSSNGFAGMLAIGDPETTVTTGACKKLSDPRDSGKYAAKEAVKKHSRKGRPDYCLIFCTPGHEEEYLMGVQDVIGLIPCYGGSASDENFTGEWKVFNENCVLEDGVVVALIYTNSDFENAFDGKYHETIKSGIVTSVDIDHRTVKEIDGKSPMRVYASWNNKKVSDYKGDDFVTESVLKPFGIKTIDGENIIIRQPITKLSSGDIKLESNIYVNQSIIKMTSSKRELIEAPGLLMREFLELLRAWENTPIAFILIQDYKRVSGYTDDELEEMHELIKDEIGDQPFIMPFVNTELGVGKSGGNYCGDLMMSFIAICE